MQNIKPKTNNPEAYNPDEKERDILE